MSMESWRKMRMSTQVSDWLKKVVATGIEWNAFRTIIRQDDTRLSKLEAEGLSPDEPIEVSEMVRVTYQDFQNCRRSQLRSTAVLDPDCWKSLDAYRERIQSEGGLADLRDLPDDHDESATILLFAFCTQWQKIQFSQYSSLLMLDSTHNTCYALENSERKIFLYTIVIKHDVAGCGIPVAFMMTTSEGQKPLVEWLSWLKTNLPLEGSPTFMIDCSRTEIAGISAVFTSPEIRLCHWHMLRAMRNKVSKKIKIDNNSAEPLTKNAARGESKS